MAGLLPHHGFSLGTLTRFLADNDHLMGCPRMSLKGDGNSLKETGMNNWFVPPIVIPAVLAAAFIVYLCILYFH
jgi:hypothetical protein